MSGQYYTAFYEATGLFYHYVVVDDSTSCCREGLEFVWDGDLPEEETKIEITGVFGEYEELGRTYYYLLADSVSAVK